MVQLHFLLGMFSWNFQFKILEGGPFPIILGLNIFFSDFSVVTYVVTHTWDYNASMSLWKMTSFEGAFRLHLQNCSHPVMAAVTTPETSAAS